MGRIFPKTHEDKKVHKANLSKARRCWIDRDLFLQKLQSDESPTLFLTSVRPKGIARSRRSSKSRFGRDHKRAEWKLYLQELMLDEVNRLTSAQIKVNAGLFHDVCRDFSDLPNLDVSIPNGFIS